MSLRTIFADRLPLALTRAQHGNELGSKQEEPGAQARGTDQHDPERDAHLGIDGAGSGGFHDCRKRTDCIGYVIGPMGKG